MQTKTCTKCGIEKELSDFYFRKDNNNYRADCKQCNNKISLYYHNTHKERISQSMKDWRNNNKMYLIEKRKEIAKETPWVMTWYRINSRCNTKTNPDYPLYGGRGIKNKLSQEDCKFLWFRDKAYLLKQASIHRKNSDGNYTISNCKYIEQKDNIGIANKENKSKKVLQYDKNNILLNEWESINSASRALNMTDTNICNALSGRTNYAGGFIWRYK